jgi:hypothetical protein
MSFGLGGITAERPAGGGRWDRPLAVASRPVGGPDALSRETAPRCAGSRGAVRFRWLPDQSAGQTPRIGHTRYLPCSWSAPGPLPRRRGHRRRTPGSSDHAGSGTSSWTRAGVEAAPRPRATRRRRRRGSQPGVVAARARAGWRLVGLRRRLADRGRERGGLGPAMPAPIRAKAAVSVGEPDT